ncbi:MAG: hypothetical protein LBT42_02535, partial [Tannerella sp.]|nr:hypothetical protein [Tannerella sp.]
GAKRSGDIPLADTRAVSTTLRSGRHDGTEYVIARKLLNSFSNFLAMTLSTLLSRNLDFAFAV